MIQLLKKLMGGNAKEEVSAALANGAIIIDVRSEGEYAGGHVKNSKNIPLNKLANQLATIKKWNKEIVCVCASGMRSSQATNFLKQNGVVAFNGGSWSSIK